jgi:hypothetical protein
VKQNDHNKPAPKITGAIDTGSGVIENSHREAGVIAGSPGKPLLLLGALGVRGLGMLVGALRVLLGLVRIFLALDVVVLAVSLGGGTMGLCRGLVMFRRLVVCVFHVEFSCWPKNLGGLQKAPQSWPHGVSTVSLTGFRAKTKWNSAASRLSFFSRIPIIRPMMAYLQWVG